MAFERPDRIIERVFIHCSASDLPEHDDVEVMRSWHTDPPPSGRGWSDVGYHFFIRKTGRLEAGRPLDRMPAAQAGHNNQTIAICLHGLEQRQFTGHQFNALVRLSEDINEAFEGQVTFHGHCEVSTKACPVFDYRKVLGLSTDGSMTQPPITQRQSNPASREARPVLRITDGGEAVMVLQILLNRAGSNLREDGIFGRATFEAVIAFQQENDLVTDGIVGPETWHTLTRRDAD